ncbi:MAG TPA: hypothetical protein PK559_12230, partial [Ignavibacteriaceae bacterium]|nr:hypothetical protein [Ignavibacteriaceae bacterium]
RKLRYLYFSNSGLVGYFNDKTVVFCPKCDLFIENIDGLFLKTPNSHYKIKENGDLYNLENNETISPTNDENFNGYGWAIINYSWTMDSIGSISGEYRKIKDYFDAFEVIENDSGQIIEINGFCKKIYSDSDCFHTTKTGLLKKIEYEEDELTIRGIVFEETFGKREFINVNGLAFGMSAKIYYDKLNTILFKDNKLIIDVNVCSSPQFIEAVNIRCEK